MRITLAFLLALLVSPLFAQQKAIVTELTIRKDVPTNETNQLIRLEFIINADIANFTYKLNKEKTIFTEIMDDTGYDLMKAQKEYQQSMESKGYNYNTMDMQYSGPTHDNSGIKIRSNISVAPNKGAKTLTLKGVAALIMVSEEEMVYDLKDVPTQLNYGQTISTEMGDISIQESGSVGFDDVDFVKYYIQSEKPVTSIEVEGGDDSQELMDKGFGVNGDEMVFKEVPEMVTVKVTARGTTIVEVPFEMVVSVGL